MIVFVLSLPTKYIVKNKNFIWLHISVKKSFLLNINIKINKTKSSKLTLKKTAFHYNQKTKKDLKSPSFICERKASSNKILNSM